MKIGKRLAMKNITAIFTAVLIAVSMLGGQKPEVAGMPLFLLILLLWTLAYAGCWIWNIRRGDSGLWRLEYRIDLVVLALLAWNMVSIVGKMFQDPDAGAIQYQFQALWIVLGLLYFAYKEVKEIKDWYWDLVIYTGLIVIGRMLLSCLCGLQIGWMAELMNDSGQAASYLLLPCLVSVFRYCFCRDRIRSVFYLLAASAGFFTLFINYNIPSLWIMVFVFLAIPVVMRPTAELVKRDMQLFFLYGFMLSNMSLLTNYTQLLQKKPELSLEHSVYLELLLAAGGVVFFQYWDRIPEGVDRDRLVLKKLRRVYLFVLTLLCAVFAILVLDGGMWAALPEAQDAPFGTAFVRSFAVPLNVAVGAGRSGWYYCLENSGVSVLLLLFLTVMLMRRMQRNHSFAKSQTAACQLTALVFLAQTLFYVPDMNTLPVWLLFAVRAAFGKEPKQNVIGTKMNPNRQNE